MKAASSRGHKKIYSHEIERQLLTVKVGRALY
jgi:hypothetical protein